MNLKKQFIAHSDLGLIDKDVSGYILADKLFDRCDVREIVGDDIEVLEFDTDSEHYLANMKEVSELATKWTVILGEQLNKEFGLNIKEREWWFIIRGFLVSLIGEIKTKHDILKKIKGQGVYCKYYEIDTILRTDNEFEENLNYSLNYHLGIWASILKCNGVEIVTETLKKNISDNKVIRKARSAIKLIQANPRRFKEKIQNILVGSKGVFPQASGEVLVMTSRMPLDIELDIVRKSNGSVEFAVSDPFASTTNKILDHIIPDQERRRHFLANIKPDNELEDLIIKLLPEYLPLSLFEGLKEMYNTASHICSKWKYRKVYHCADETDLFRFCMGIMAAQKGSLICDMQHAMTYSLNFYVGYKEYVQYDRFITWGWKSDEIKVGSFRRAAITRQPIKPIREHERKNKILLLALAVPILAYGKDGFYMGDYCEHQKSFISSLSPELRGQLVVRTDMPEDVSDLRRWCRKNYPAVKFESLRDIMLSDSVMESRLVITDYYGSAHIESYISGEPFVMYDGLKLIEFNPVCKPYLKKMKELGIYYENGKELAEAINQKEDYDVWLMSEEVKNLLEEYKNTMTGLNNDIADVWLKEFIGD